MSDSSPVPAFQALLLQSETGILRRDSDVDNLDILNNHTSPSGSSVLSSSINTETGLNAKEVSSGASTVTSICTTTSSSGTSHNVADEGKEQIVAPKTQGYKAGTSIVLQMNAPPHPVDEFLLQLTKMLTDDNKDYIEWRNASVFVTDPPGLEKFILPRYFRHSNYSTFQRQMNYFGFRKIVSGRGKMLPCSYVNENAKEDISSLLLIKRRKTGVKGKKAPKVVAQHAARTHSKPVGSRDEEML